MTYLCLISSEEQKLNAFLALIAADTPSTGGLSALAMKKPRARSGAKNTPKQFPSQEI